MNQQNHIVSIIIPSYNKENYLHDCLISCINQTYKDIEIIVVDDFSADNGIAIASNILEQSTIRNKIIRHKKNKGLSAARNTGLKHASGKYVFFLDADDTIDNTLIESLVSIAKQKLYDLHIVPFATIRRFTAVEELTPTYSPCKSSTDISYKLCKKNYFYYACGILLDKEIIEKFNVVFREDIKKHEDIIFLAEYLCYVHMGTTVNSNYNYRVTPNSITTQCCYADRVKVLNEMYSLFYKPSIQDCSSIITFIRVLKNGIFLAKDYPFNYRAIKELPCIRTFLINHTNLSLRKKILEYLLSYPLIEYCSYRVLRLVVKA